MKLRNLISTLAIITLIIPLFIFACPLEIDAKATYQTIRENNSNVTGGLITIGQSAGTAKLYHQQQNDQNRTEIPLGGRSTYTVPCNGYYSVLFYDNSGKMLSFNAWNVTNLSACER